MNILIEGESHQGRILAKEQFHNPYTFWAMPILIFSPVQIIMSHPLGIDQLMEVALILYSVMITTESEINRSSWRHIYRVTHNYLDWAKYQNRHSSKSIWVMELYFCQNERGKFWQKNSFITYILFELCLFWYLAQFR